MLELLKHKNIPEVSSNHNLTRLVILIGLAQARYSGRYHTITFIDTSISGNQSTIHYSAILHNFIKEVTDQDLVSKVHTNTYGIVKSSDILLTYTLYDKHNMYIS